MKPTKRSVLRLLPAAVLAAFFAVGGAYAQSLQPNQTEGFSAGKLVKFTYQQNFACVHQPKDDLDYNGVMAQSDSGEFQTPICQAGIQPTIDPTGDNAKRTAILYVLVPMFSLDKDQNSNDAIPCPTGVRAATLCGPALGKVLIELFGAVPEAYKIKPLVFTDCPGPGSMPGTCTMHASTVDLGKVLVALGKLPAPATNVFLPTPNHSHVIARSRANTERAIWWEVEPVLVTDPADWPDQSGNFGITSVRKLRQAEQRGQAVQVPSNFFLFFSSKSMQGMPGMDDQD
ncbi:hypothetical protein [Rhodanobacter sp. DHB23]|uniref:hypothetical protein n=1 Tax=Rhodanobacter sp. DHB23 TaxID=2775923 RepID=UPI001785D091|nr:hypothetical protein [Rhodanobacter sp. DHB23]MBD8873703.1 hypothetical protein [Rhodanobacter sp. DHB23]